jgi:hypothetical protein
MPPEVLIPGACVKRRRRAVALMLPASMWPLLQSLRLSNVVLSLPACMWPLLQKPAAQSRLVAAFLPAWGRCCKCRLPNAVLLLPACLHVAAAAKSAAAQCCLVAACLHVAAAATSAVAH